MWGRPLLSGLPSLCGADDNFLTRICALARSPLGPLSPLHRHLGLEALQIAEDRGDCERAAAEAVAQEAILGVDVAVYGDIVPFLGVADTGDLHIVVLTPKERDGFEGLAPAEHIQRRDLALALRDHPVLDPDALAAVRVRPARDVAGGENSRHARLEHGVHRDAAVDGEPGGFG